MGSRLKAALALMALTAAAWTGSSGSAMPQPASPATPQHEIPQSLRLEHQETLERLNLLAKHPGAVGVEARKALVLFKQHIAREEEYILPPLTLLPILADGKVTPDMRWALAMTDRVKAEREQIFQEHTRLTDALNALVTAAHRTHDQAAIQFAEAAEGDALNDVELLEPTVVLIGEYLHSKLPAAQ